MQNLLLFRYFGGLLFLLLMATGHIQAQDKTSPYEVKVGNPLRKTLLDVIRKPTTADLGQNVEFVVSAIRTKGAWAFAHGMIQQPGGKPLDRKQFVEKSAILMANDGVFDDNFQAVLQLKQGKWIVTKYALGCTDVCWLEWLDLKGIPKEIFPNF
jgi:hypothetical protein